MRRLVAILGMVVLCGCTADSLTVVSKLAAAQTVISTAQEILTKLPDLLTLLGLAGA